MFNPANMARVAPAATTTDAVPSRAAQAASTTTPPNVTDHAVAVPEVVPTIVDEEPAVAAEQAPRTSTNTAMIHMELKRSGVDAGGVNNDINIHISLK